MPERGGSSNISGVIFELWYTALQISEIYFNPHLKVTPQAKTKKTIDVDENGNTIEKDDIVYCDDLMCESENSFTHYNIKTYAPNDKGSWSINDLIKSKVLTQFKKSFNSKDKSQLVFVSQNPCKTFIELINRAKFNSNPSTFFNRLPPKYQRDWKILKDFFRYNDNQLIQFSKFVNFEFKVDYKSIEQEIVNKFKYQVNDEKRAAQLVFEIASKYAIWGATITHDILIEVFNNEHIYPISAKNLVTIKELFKSASFSLSDYQNHFKTKDSLHIPRKETSQIFDWINSTNNDNKRNNILLLIGTPGSGKSSILKDVLLKLQEDNICVLGIKTDHLMVNSRDELEHELLFSENLETIINTAAINQKTVLIIDQIDALSQFLSTNKKSIQVYLNLISKLKTHNSIRIIISCRTFDLDYDPLLIEIKENPQVKVGLLKADEINEVLNSFQLKYEKLPVDLQELLQIPLHLNIFCSIYKPEIHLSKFTTIQDLYNELWHQKISFYTEQNCDELLFKIAEKMSSDQVLSVPKVYFEKYKSELKILAHEGLIIDDSKKIQFFHQTFFDYTFARSFVTSQKSLVQLISDRHQGLFIRSIIIQILEYYRNIDPEKYASQLGHLLCDSSVRYHIKHLVIYWLSKIDIPTKIEENVFEKYILPNSIHFENFIEMFSSKGWIKYFIQKDIFISILNDTQTNVFKILSWKLRILMKDNSDELLSFIQKVSSQVHLQEVTGNALFGLKDWSNPLAYEIFDTAKDYFYKIDRRHLNHFIFYNALQFNPSWVLNNFHELILPEISHKKLEHEDLNKIFDYDEIELMKALFKKIPDETSKTLLNIIWILINATKMKGFNSAFVDSAFWNHNHDNDRIYNYRIFLDLLEEYGAAHLSKDIIKFTSFFKDYLKTDSVTLLALFFSIYVENPFLFKNYFYRIIFKNNFFNSYYFSSYLEINTQKAINKIYPFFSEKQKDRFNRFVLKWYPAWEKRKEKHKSIGYSQFVLMQCIPEKELKKPQLYKRYMELYRKFKYPQNEFKSRKKTIISRVESPLPAKAYEKMTLNQWLISFNKYKEKSSTESKKDFLSGGFSQHAMQFKESVKKNPQKFYEFIVSLEKENIPIRYISQGIAGLKEASYNSQKLKRIVKQYALKYESSEFKKDIVSIIDTLVISKAVDKEIIKILIFYIENDKEEEIIFDDAYTIGINTLRGQAIRNLTRIGSIPKYSKVIFPILLRYSKNNSVSFRACMIHELVYLLRIDKFKTLEIFLELVKDKNEDVLVNGLNSFQYLLRDYFPNLNIYINILMKTTIEYFRINTQYFLAQVLLFTVFDKVKESELFFEELLAYSNMAKAGAVNYAIRHLDYKDVNIRTISRTIFIRFLNEDDEKIAQEYEHGFYDLPITAFNELYPALEIFSHSKASIKAGGNFYEYLAKVVTLHPQACLKLLQNFSFMELPDVQFNAIGSKPVQILIQAYNQIRKYDKGDPILESAMDTFDKMLSHPSFKIYASEVLKFVDN